MSQTGGEDELGEGGGKEDFLPRFLRALCNFVLLPKLLSNDMGRNASYSCLVITPSSGEKKPFELHLISSSPSKVVLPS